jgi:muramoyltetrapeptide carboxypeptidase
VSERSRRLFLRALLGGGALILPGALGAQVLPGESSREDTTRPESTPRRSLPTSGARRRRGTPSDRELIRPPALGEGSTIAIVAPASGVSQAEALDSAATLRNLGFKVKLGRHLTKGFGYLAAQDVERAEEFMGFIHDPEVDCVMAVRGGYGVMRILPRLDFEAIRANPKVIIGFSDITALVNPVYQLSGMIAFHGPVANSSFDPYTLDSFRRTVMNAGPAGTFGESEEFKGTLFSERRATTMISGRAQGRLVGGNLSLVTALMGTPWDIDTTGKILFLEEVHEEPYKVDRMLTQLALGGKLAAAAGVALGRFTKGESGASRAQLSLEQILRGVLEPLKIPCVYGLAIGHIRSKLTVPVGALATLDADAKTLTIDEAAVSR